MTNIIGISAFYHDSAAALVRDGVIIAAVQEERFTRLKNDASFPVNAIKFCLAQGGIEPENIDHIVFYDKPFVKFERLIETYLAFAPKGFRSFAKSMPTWLKDKLFQKKNILDILRKQIAKNIKWEDKLLFSEHHLSHAASAYYPSPFSSALVLTMDGVGEWATTSVALGKGNALSIEKELHFPHSLGLLYSAFTYYLGFEVNNGEYKVMGLAPYGEPKFKDLILKELVHLKSDGSFQLNQQYFDYCTGLTMTNAKFNNLFGKPPRHSKEPMTQEHMDIAASIQAATEEIFFRLVKVLKQEYQEDNLCLAGGVALNCVANGKLVKQKMFNNIWIQPAAGDAGGALGAALAIYYMFNKKERVVEHKDSMQGAYLGPSFSSDEIESFLKRSNVSYVRLDQDKLIEKTVELLESEKVVGWFQGRAEFGPRALGARSILADPRSVNMQRNLNLKVKFRESFRPFAPAVLREDLTDWFKINCDSPYMLLVADVKEDKHLSLDENYTTLFGIEKLNVPRSVIPSVTHVDYSARIQTVDGEYNYSFYKLLQKFKEKTGCPILVNTSFNVNNEPIVCSPEDAYRCFMSTQIDVLVMGEYMVLKSTII